MPLAVTIGALNVLDDVSNGYKCSRNCTTARTHIKEAFRYFNTSDDLEAFSHLHLAGAQVDDMGLNCYYAFINDITADHMKGLVEPWPKELMINVLYNAGRQWVDVVNYVFYTPWTVPNGDWGFFFFYLIGDFGMRFLYRDSTP